MYKLVYTSFFFVFFFKQKTAYEMRISDWSSDVCSSDLVVGPDDAAVLHPQREDLTRGIRDNDDIAFDRRTGAAEQPGRLGEPGMRPKLLAGFGIQGGKLIVDADDADAPHGHRPRRPHRSRHLLLPELVSVLGVECDELSEGGGAEEATVGIGETATERLGILDRKSTRLNTSH